MRLLSCLGVILLVLIGGGFWINNSLQESTDRLSSQVEQVSDNIGQGDWSAARSGSDQMQRLWEKDARWWPVILDHQEIDNIEFSMARTTEYVRNQDLALAQGQLSELKLMVRHIPRKEKINLENIL
ncbi:MAG: DUF4363 family protein [Deltaproteobacteria bacterium]